MPFETWRFWIKPYAIWKLKILNKTLCYLKVEDLKHVNRSTWNAFILPYSWHLIEHNFHDYWAAANINFGANWFAAEVN